MSDSLLPSESLYPRVLGESYALLPPVLRRFHTQASEATAQGTLHITRGPGWFRNLLATLLRLPPPGTDIPIHLHVRVEGRYEHWSRHFAAQKLLTKQWHQNGLLIETAGPMRFGFRLTADDVGMQFHFVRCWLWVVPLPLVLSPRVHATVRGLENSWWVKVTMEVPVFGLLTSYEGEVTPQC